MEPCTLCQPDVSAESKLQALKLALEAARQEIADALEVLYSL